ncbi:MAG: flotillin family protein [Flavobacterium sp.]|jgi:flotillin|uniref:Membrane protein YqiK n=2 Tax=Flavobacteriaceae TaxID=49546 RepID=A0A497UWK0_9FLAO|nr:MULTISPECIES: SPFH domain-containing protein [Flavobacterium]MBU7570649.1 flotillin family protein [Flavobacterium sp.]PZO25253.1 MAG: flotillin [Flavobacteriaceae bacterium]PZQ87519.1 MAG: flotillin [Flavobacterium johnsoniae]KQS50008.1 Band 7 family protein [Flavobacterium sp. Leaf359]PKW29128.1 putative membrane protein YqiK [Flavobacterium lindanitolerans]
MLGNSLLITMIAIIIVVIGLLVWVISMYKKIIQGKVIVRTGAGGTKVFYNAGLVVPVLHKMEIMDISVKKLDVERTGVNGLICKDNIRADIKVTFFIKINKSTADIINVAQTIGCERASEIDVLRNLFDAKFSEALKTVGKKFDFVELYEARSEFREEIIAIIGTDLNGYVLDDCAIDDLEQTPLSQLKADNILDSEGIKKITELTAAQNIKANLIRRDEEKTIRKQDVEAKEAILALDRQLAEKEEQQKREIANIKAREEAEIVKVSEEERLKAETARINTTEKVMVAEENKDRLIIVAAKNKQRTEAVETERVEKDRALEQTERERIVTLAQIEKEKAVEVERKNIQNVIRDRVVLEKGVVQEQENMKDIEAFKEADRQKKVAVTLAEKESEELYIKRLKAAEAEKEAAKQKAEEINIEAAARMAASEKEAEARKILAEAKAKEDATLGLSEAQVMHAKADANERQGIVDAVVIEKKALAEAAGIKAKAEAEKQLGVSEAEVIKEKALAEASGIEEKAEAMKKLDGVGKDHEEFKLRLNKELQVDLAHIHIQKDIADAQANVLAEALRSAKIDIVGGETMFFDQIVGQITKAKGFDRLVNGSENITEIKEAILGNDSEGGENLLERIKGFADKYGITSEDIKNLTVAGLLVELQKRSNDEGEKGLFSNLMDMAKNLGLSGKKLG